MQRITHCSVVIFVSGYYNFPQNYDSLSHNWLYKLTHIGSFVIDKLR